MNDNRYDYRRKTPLYAMREMHEAVERRGVPTEIFARNESGNLPRIPEAIPARRQIVADMYSVGVLRRDITSATGVSHRSLTTYLLEATSFYKPPVIDLLYSDGFAEYVAVKWRNEICQDMGIGLGVFATDRTSRTDTADRREVFIRMHEAGFSFASISRACNFNCVTVAMGVKLLRKVVVAA